MRLIQSRCAKVLGVIFLIFLIPLYWIARYDYLSGDDFWYLAQTQQVWQQTGSVVAVVKAALQQTVQRYVEWQGNFSFIFLTFFAVRQFW